MNILKKSSIYLAAFWYAWWLPYKIRRTKLPVPDFLEQLCSRNTHGHKVSAEEIYKIVTKTSRFFLFHRRKRCMANSMALLKLLSSYGYSAYLVMGMHYKHKKHYSCHCEVFLEEHLNNEILKSMKVIQKSKRFIMIEEDGREGGDSRCLMSCLPITATRTAVTVSQKR